MNKENAFKAKECQKSKKINIIVKGSDKVLRSKSFYTFEDKNEVERGEEMTTTETVNLLEILKEKGYTLEDAIKIFKRIAKSKK